MAVTGVRLHMADEKEIPETPESILSDNGEDLSVAADGERDPILEQLLKSKSDDDGDSSPASSKKSKTQRKQKKSKAVAPKTGTSLDKKKRLVSPLVAIVAASALLLGGGGLAASLYLTPSDSQLISGKDSDKTKDIAGTGKDGEKEFTEKDLEKEKMAPWNQEGTEYPIEMENWQKTGGGVSSTVTSDLYPQIVETYYGSDFDSSAGILPSEAAGFTPDENLVTLEDDSLNPFYSFWTKELFIGETGVILEKFLNPTYGSWDAYQGKGEDPNSIKPDKLFKGVFTTRLLEEGGAVSSWLPIYADWSGNSYGRNDLPQNGPRWFGEVTSSTAEFTWNEEEEQYSAKFVGQVKFVSYTSEGKKVSKDGTMTLTFVANPSGERGAGGKVLVDQANLTIGG